MHCTILFLYTFLNVGSGERREQTSIYENFIFGTHLAAEGIFIPTLQRLSGVGGQEITASNDVLSLTAYRNTQTVTCQSIQCVHFDRYLKWRWLKPIACEMYTRMHRTRPVRGRSGY